MRTGAEYLASLNDGRRVFLDGEVVADVSAHPAFREAARSIARLYDIAADPANRERMTFPSPKTGAPVQRAWQIPKTHADLRARRLFSETWAEATFGLMGRAPDHVAGFFSGYAAVPSFFASAGEQKFADNLTAFYEFMRDNHVYCSYAIVPPQIDRTKPAHQQSDPTLYAGVVKERDDGIVIKGAQQLATGGAISDYIHLSCIQPLQKGDENYANCLAVPVAAEGVKLYPRKPYSLAGSAADYPLSSRFDESDSYVVFDNVFVPWERVFIYRNVELSRDQWRKTPSHLYGNHQAQTRYVTKLRFMAGLAQRMNETTGNSANPAVVGLMGELCSLVSIYEAMLHAHETMGTDRGRRALAVAHRLLCRQRHAVGIQRPHAGNFPRDGRRGFHHAALLRRRFSKPRNRRRPRPLHALGLSRRQDARQIDAADLGFPRLRIRQPPRAVREILRRAVVRGEAASVSLFRF